MDCEKFEDGDYIPGYCKSEYGLLYPGREIKVESEWEKVLRNFGDFWIFLYWISILI